jgi:ubiquinone/menaquinone biosynthesis C-methylase UbiE/DNA-binding transcriptional ArsR family regulator
MNSILQRMRFFSEPTRLRLFCLLQQEELTVAELQEILNMGQPRISTLLAQLRNEGVVEDRRAGKNSYYKASLFLEEKWQKLLLEAHQEIEEAESDFSSLKLILKRRNDRAAQYFQKLAGQFGHTYLPGRSWHALTEGLIALLPPLMIADLGAGEGTLAQLMARSAKHVIALDNQPKTVELGQKKATENGFHNLEYRLGNVENPPIHPNTIDLVIMSQLLRHLINPEEALEAAFRILKPGGKILILEITPHQDEAVREHYRHLWPGFSGVMLHHLLEKAQFIEIMDQIFSPEEKSPHFQPILAVAKKPSRISK